MSKICRVTDLGIGVDTEAKGQPTVIGHIITGSPNVFLNNLPVARNTDLVLSIYGHIGIIVSSHRTSINGLSIARVGDPFTGVYIGHLIGGSSNGTSGT